MPVVRIDYEKSVSAEEIQALAAGLQPAIAEASALPLEDICVYANQNGFSINAAPIEVYIHAGPGAIPDGNKEVMLARIVEEVKKLKQEKGLSTPINLSVVQMDWRFELGV